MTFWTHFLCDECWDKLGPDRPPSRLVIAGVKACRSCGVLTESGIVVRDDPKVSR